MIKMALRFGIQQVITNIGVSFEWTVLIIAILATMPFFAKDFKTGIIALMLSAAGLFVWFYELGYNYTLPLIIFFMSIIVMALSLYGVQSSSATGGFT